MPNPRTGDFGDTASQYSDKTAASVWQFLTATADVFELTTTNPEVIDFKVTRVVASFVFWGEGASSSNPSSAFEGIYTYVFGNSALDLPSGTPREIDLERLKDGIHRGGSIFDEGATIEEEGDETVPTEGFFQFPVGVIAMKWTPVSEFTSVDSIARTIPGEYRWNIDFPVDVTVGINTTYWLCLIPSFPAPPQVGWNLSDTLGSGLSAVRGGVGVPFWTEIDGNSGFNRVEIPGTFKNMSFDIFSTERVAI